MPVFQPVRPLAAVQFQVERVNIEHSVPMYAPELISTVSSLSQPSDNLLHHCYAHIYLKVSKEVLLYCCFSNADWPLLILNTTAYIWKIMQLISFHFVRS